MDTEIKFPGIAGSNRAEVHLIIGANGTGKSTVLYALAGLFRPLNEFKDRIHKEPVRVNLAVQLESESKPLPVSDCISMGYVNELNRRAVAGSPGHFFRAPAEDELTQYLAVEDLRRVTCRFAAFAYSGNRLQARLPEMAVGEQRPGPLRNALNFQGIRTGLDMAG